MVIIGQLSIPEQGVVYSSNDVKLKIDQTTLNEGVLYVTESSFCWKPNDREEGISILWKNIALHAIQSQPTPSVYVMLDFCLEWPGVYEGGPQKNGNGNAHENNEDEDAADDEDNDEGNESDGLFGNNGILPARTQLENLGSSKISPFHQKPTFLHFSSYLGLNVSYMVDVIALIGAIISFVGFVSQRFCVVPTFAALWTLYYSLIQIAQNFTNQADYLLLEAGAVMLILAPIACHKKRSPVDNVGFVMLRWVLFRFIFASGAVKLASGCPLWWNLTALKGYFETMPLPTPLSWYAFHIPDIYLKLNVIFALATDLICPWLFFFPNRIVRRFAFYWHVFLQIHIIITGNFGFLNFLLVVLLLSLLDDTPAPGQKNRLKSALGYLLTLLILGGVAFGVYHYFGVAFKNGQISLKVMFNKKEYADTLKMAIRAGPLVAAITLISTFMNTIISHTSITKAKSFLRKMFPILNLLVFTVLSLAMVGLSTVPHHNLQASTNVTNTELGQMYKRVKNLNMINEYGQHLRDMRTERLEIVLEHADNIEGPWIEYGFQYKPWNVNHSLPFSGPYLPRIDFEMWRAAPSNYNNQLWITSLAYRLLQNDRFTLMLLGQKQPLRTPPKFVRGTLYRMKFTSWAERNNHAYWTRQRVGEYFPAYSLDHGPMIAFLKTLKISTTYKAPAVQNQLLKNILDQIRNFTYSIEGSLLLFGVLTAAFAIVVTTQKKQQ